MFLAWTCAYFRPTDPQAYPMGAYLAEPGRGDGNHHHDGYPNKPVFQNRFKITEVLTIMQKENVRGAPLDI